MRIVFLGDTLLGGQGEETLQERGGYEYAVRGVLPFLRGADLVVINQEGPLTNATYPGAKIDTGKKRYWYRGRHEAAQALATIGVGVASLANNHILDFGLPGLAETMSVLDAAGIRHCGAGLNRKQARKPVIVTVGQVRIGFISCMQTYRMYLDEAMYAGPGIGGCYRLRPRSLARALAALEGRVDLRVVLAHWGRNYRSIRSRQRRLAKGLVAAGADLIIGHHPHVAHPIQLVNGTPVFYSLGNGVLGTIGRFHSGRSPYGMIAIVELERTGRITALEAHLIEVDNARVAYSPVPAEGEEARQFLRTLVSEEDGWTACGHGLRTELVPAKT